MSKIRPQFDIWVLGHLDNKIKTVGTGDKATLI